MRLAPRWRFRPAVHQRCIKRNVGEGEPVLIGKLIDALALGKLLHFHADRRVQVARHGGLALHDKGQVLEMSLRGDLARHHVREQLASYNFV